MSTITFDVVSIFPAMIEAALAEGVVGRAIERRLLDVAIHDLRIAEATMTSPYLAHIRSTRKIIEELIGAREIELAKTTAAAQRRCVEQDLTFLREELARVDSATIKRLAGCNRRRLAPR